MGSQVCWQKRLKMKAALLVVITIFTFALATNVKKSPSDKPIGRSRISEIPRCAEKEKEYKYGKVVGTTDGFDSANACAELCKGILKCRFWKIYLPTAEVSSLGVVGQCIQLAEHPRPHLVDREGWISGTSGCIQ